MATPVFDLSPQIVVTATAFPATPNYTYTVPPNKTMVLEELSFAVNGSFNTKGKMFVKIRDQVITTQSGAQAAGGVGLLANYTLSFRSPHTLVKLDTAEKIEVSILSDDGTSVTAQVSVSGELLDTWEVENLVRNLEGKVMLVGQR